MDAIALTDHDWFHRLRDLQPSKPVNFWTPTGWYPKRMEPGDRLYFLLRAPIRKVGGFGRFVEFRKLTSPQAWEAFDERNGVESPEAMLDRLREIRRRRDKEIPDPEEHEIGCIVLRDTEFWPDERFRPPEDEVGVEVHPRVVTFQYLQRDTDMPRVVIQPAASRVARNNFRRTVESSVALDTIRSLVSESLYQELGELYPTNEFYVWGVRPGSGGSKEKMWEDISRGDVAVFAWESQFRAAARVTATTDNAPLARELWGSGEDGQDWRLIYFLSEPESCSIPYPELAEAIGYKPGWVPRGFQVLDEEQSEAVLELVDVTSKPEDSEWPTTWWVNQGSTYAAHRELGIVWAPQEGKDGTYEHHENVAKLSPGDRILHYKDKAIRAVGFVTGEPFETEQSPDDGRDRWNEEGYQASVEYHPLDEPVGRDEIPLAWRQEEGAPFTSGGELRQGYLYSLSEEFAKKVAGRFPQIGQHFPDVGASRPGSDTVTANRDLEAVCNDFAEKVKDAGLTFGDRHEAFVRDFVVSLATKQLVILTGLSGSGKTQIALQFGRWLGEDRSKVVPVRPDWTGAEALFGYPDALREPSDDGRQAWHVPGPLKFMLRAYRDREHPYLMVLDEMNLAHVERYFADVISGMESGEGCLPNLREEDGVWREAPEGPDKLPFPKNLFIAGTVNVDETTYMFSPKVLDRANTMEFRVRTEDLDADLRKPGECEPGDPSLTRGFLEIARDEDYHREHTLERQDEYFGALEDLHRSLDQAFSFGHRVVYEAIRFAALHEEAGGDSMEEALDTQVLQKILPRLHGSRRQLEPVLETVGKFCWDLAPAESGNPGSSFDPADPPEGKPELPRSFDKVQRMTERLRTNQFVSFTE